MFYSLGMNSSMFMNCSVFCDVWYVQSSVLGQNVMFESVRSSVQFKDLFYRWQNVSNSTLYPDVLKIKTNCCETKFYKNAICLLFTNFQIHHLATLLPGRPSNRVARYGFVNKKMAFLKNFVWQQSLFCFQNIWIQCRIRHILSTLKQILGVHFV